MQHNQNDCHQWLSGSYTVHQIRFRPGLTTAPILHSRLGRVHSPPTWTPSASRRRLRRLVIDVWSPKKSLNCTMQWRNTTTHDASESVNRKLWSWTLRSHFLHCVQDSCVLFTHLLGLKIVVVSGNPSDPSLYSPTLKILRTYLCKNDTFTLHAML